MAVSHLNLLEGLGIVCHADERRGRCICARLRRLRWQKKSYNFCDYSAYFHPRRIFGTSALSCSRRLYRTFATRRDISPILLSVVAMAALIDGLWRFPSRGTAIASTETLDDLESGQLQDTEKTPLLPASVSIEQDARDSEPTSARATSRRSLPNIRLNDLLYSILLAPVYSVLIFLPMLPFWIFAGFLVYLLG